MGSILISASQPAERWVVRGIALGGKIRLSRRVIMIDCHPFHSIPVIFFVTGLHGLAPKLGILLMNVSLSASRFGAACNLDMRCQDSQCFQDRNSTFHCHQRYVQSTFYSYT